MRETQMSRDEAETVAVAALGFLAGDPERLSRFLALTGIDPGNIRTVAGHPAFLASVLDHVMSDESLLLAFSANGGIAPERIAPARRLLDSATGQG